MGKYDTILFGESGTDKPQYQSKYDNILFGTTTQPAETPAGEVVSETQENTEDPLAGLPQQETKKDFNTLLGDYGISAEYGNKISYDDLNARLKADNVPTDVRRNLQQEWFKGYQKYIDRLQDGDEKKAHQEHLKALSERPSTYLKNTWYNALAEGASRGIVGTEAAAEGVKNLATSYVGLSDEEVLAKYYPELAEQVKKAGGVDQLRQIGMATKLQGEDLSGMGTTALHGSTPEQRELGTKLLNALADARSQDALNRIDKEGEEVVMDDGRVVKMSNLQASDYYNKAPSRIAGEDEAAKEFNEDVLKSLATANGWKHLINAGAQSAAQNVPTLVAGTAAAFVSAPVGIAIMQSGNITDQQLQGIQDLADKEYKKLHGEDANVTDLSSADYLNFLTDLAKEGKVSDKAAESFKTGFAMTLAEQATGGVVGKLGSKLAGMSAKTLAGKIASTAGALGIHATDEGWQEVSSQIVENVSKGKPWNEGLTQAFVQGTFSLEGVAQHTAKGIGKLKEIRDARTQNLENVTEQNLAESAQLTEEKPVEQPEVEPSVEEINNKLADAREDQDVEVNPTREQLLTEYDAITNAIGKGEPTPEQAQRIAEIEGEFTTQETNDKGQAVTRNDFAKTYRDWQTGQGEFAQPQDTIDESRTDNRDGSQDVDGQSNEQGAVVSDTSATEHSGQTSETVSPVETETTTTGHREPDTGAVENPVEQPNNNETASDPTGLDGRTGETVGGRREQGELGQEGSQQSSQPSQTPSAGSTDSGVRERTQSDSVGETLTEIEGKQYRRTSINKPTESTVKAKVFRGGNVEGRGVVWSSTNEAVAHLYKSKKGDAVAETDVELKTPRVVDAKGGLYSQVKFDQSHPKNAVAKKYPALYEEVSKMMYGDVKGMSNLFKASDRLVFDTLVNNALVNAGVIKGKVHDGVVMENVIDPSGKSGEFKSAKNEQLLGDNVVTFNQKDFLAKTKEILAPQKEKPSVTDLKVEKENAKRRAIEAAVASEKERLDSPYAKEFKGNDLRTNQRKAHELLKGADEKTEEEIRKAFFENTVNASSASFEAAKRGYLRANSRNPKHAAFKGSRVDLVGFDFNDNPVYKDQEIAYEDIKKSTAVEDKVTELLANPDLIENIAEFHKKAVDDAFNVKYLEGKREQVLTEALPYLRDTEGKPITDTAKVTDSDLVSLAIDNAEHKVIDLKSLLGRFLKRLNAILSAVVAVVGVGAMTIPQDAHAQAGFATYESGPQIAGVSQEASNTINWVKASHDNNGKIFVVADKNEGKIHIVDNNGKVLDTQNAIFGRNKSNDNVANSTPSGRFKLQKALTTKAADKRVFGDDVLTLTDTVTGNNITKSDGGVIAMHRLWNKSERVKAINSATASDNYMSAGCINVPTAFYNSAVDSLDGAMVYILDNKDAPKAGNATQKVAKSSTNTKTEFAKTTPAKQGKFGVSKVKFSTADLKALDTSLTKEKVQSTLKRVLGDHAKNVTVISRADFNSTQASHYINKNGIEGFYDDATGHVYIVADGIHAQNGLSAEDRVGFVAWHEMTHLGLDTKYGNDLRAILQSAASNETIAKLADKIQQERINRGEAVAVNDDMAVEEALAELNAALKTDNVKALEDRYGVTIPEGLRSQTEKATDNLFTRIRNVVRKLLGKPVMTNQQVKDLFAGLDESIAKHAAPEAVAITARLNEIAHDVEQGVNLDVDYSVKSAVQAVQDFMSNFAESVTDKLTGEKHSSSIADPAGFNPNSIDTTRVQKQRIKGGLTTRERLFEAFADSQFSAIKYIGGYSTALAHKIKTTVNAVAHKQKQFQKKVFAFSDMMREAAKSRPDLYTRKNRQAIDTDVMVVTTALSAVTKSTSALSSNEAIREKYTRLLDGFDYTDAKGNVQHKNGLREELAAYGYDPANQSAIVYTPYQLKKLNQMYAKVKEYEEILATFDKNKNVLLNEAGLTREEALKQRKNWRGHNGMTNADAYNAITKAVEQGKIDVTYDGKPWLDYIKDVGFTKDKGFADTSKNYELSYDKLKVDGFLYPLVDTYVKTAKEFYQYQHDNLGSDLTGQVNENPFFTPTMGKASEIKTKSNMVGDTFYIDENRQIEDRINDAMAAEWQGQHMGRAWTGSGTLNNLNTLAALSAKRVGQTEVGKEIYKLGMKGDFKIRVVTTTDPNFGEAKGYLITTSTKGGNKQYLKVSLDNDRANNALFMDNVITPNNALLDIARSVRSVFSVMITMMPAFSVYNAWKGFGEKRSQIKAFAMNKKVGYFFEDLKDQSEGYRAKFAAELFRRSYANVIGGMFNRGYLRAALAMALAEGDKAPKDSKFREFLLKSPEAKTAYARLQGIANNGGISTRADAFKFSQEELQRAYEKDGIIGAVSRNIAQAQTRALTFTTAMEMVSTLATVDTLQEMGLSEKKAIEANLWFMNFNDKGASALSGIMRSVVPFANATAQGARSTTRSLETKNGWVNFAHQAIFRAAWLGVAAMAMEMFPCEDGGDKETLRDYNSGELMRSTPFKIGCLGTLRLPIAYGADMISAAVGTSVYQTVAGNWDLPTAVKHVWHATAENMNVAPTPPGDSNIFETVAAPITPRMVQVMYNVLRDKDDFGNKISRQGSDNLKEKWAAGKNTTADAWTLLAKSFDMAGVNITPEQARYVVSSFAPPLAGLVDALDKPLQTQAERESPAVTRMLKTVGVVTGSKTIIKSQQSPSQRTFAQVNNNLSQYKDIVDEINVSAERKELKFGSASANTQSWLKRKIADGTFKKEDEAKVRVILDYQKRQKQISSSKLSADKKNEKYYQSNRRYLEEMHALEDK
jgi:putative uncharacterized protein (fragment)|nr:MAG TPA: hypothetical protein [Caudoviricetes sp.]DAN51512.1 MAG TPA: hypothetical protein [Caudoviricetes sp.]